MQISSAVLALVVSRSVHTGSASETTSPYGQYRPGFFFAFCTELGMHIENLDAPKQPAAPSRKSVATAYLAMALTYLIGGGSMVLWALFISPLPTFSIDLHLAAPLALLVDLALCLAFFIAHSGMMRQSFRTWLGRFVGPQYHSALFAIVSGMLLIACVILWQKSAVVFFHAQGLWALPFYALMILSFAGSYWGGRALGAIDLLGAPAILRHLRQAPPRPDADFVVRGPYQWVRHPLKADAETWLKFLAKDKALLPALLMGKIKVRGSPKLMKDFARCFPM